MSAEFLTGINVTQVNFNRGNGYSFKCIQYGYTGMGICCGVDYNAVKYAICLLDLIYYFTFVVGLEALHLESKVKTALKNERLKCLIVTVTVDSRLTQTKKVQVRTVYDKYFFHAAKLYNLLICAKVFELLAAMIQLTYE